MKICPVGAELLHADRRTDMTKANKSFFALLQTRLKNVISNGVLLVKMREISCYFGKTLNCIRLVKSPVVHFGTSAPVL